MLGKGVVINLVVKGAAWVGIVLGLVGSLLIVFFILHHRELGLVILLLGDLYLVIFVLVLLFSQKSLYFLERLPLHGLSIVLRLDWAVRLAHLR